MLKIENIFPYSKGITPAAKYLVFGVILVLTASFINKKHPYYISVVDIKYNVPQKTLQVSARMFTNDLEDALYKINAKKIDLLNPTNKPALDSVLFSYIKQCLQISVNTKLQALNYIGYEKEDESIWVYLEIKKVISPKNLTIKTQLLYEYLSQQTNIVHAEINSVKKSSKVTNPDKKVEFNF